MFYSFILTLNLFFVRVIKHSKKSNILTDLNFTMYLKYKDYLSVYIRLKKIRLKPFIFLNNI